MGWFNRQKQGEKQAQIPSLPELPDSHNVVPPLTEDLSSTQSPSEIPIPPSPSRPLTREYNEEGGQTFEQQKPTMQKSIMQKSRFVPPASSQIPIPPRAFVQPIQETHEESFQQRSALQKPGFLKSPSKSFPRKDEPVYVKLDKFQATIQAFKEIRDKIREIEELLVRTKEIKAREEKEIEEWEREIETIKLKIESIDNEIFQQ